MKLESQQEWVKDLMFYIISSLQTYNADDMFSTGYGYTINAAIDNYTLTYYDEKENKNIGLYQRYYKNYISGNYRNVLLSKKAFDLLSEASDCNLSKIEDENKVFHGEHLTPMSYTRRFLNSLLDEKDHLSEAELKARIRFAFSQSKFCIITKEESMLLDGKEKKYSRQEIDEFINEYRMIKKISKETENIYRELEGKPKKSYGFGAIRMWSMNKGGVEFVDYKGNAKTFSECLAYLEDNVYKI